MFDIGIFELLVVGGVSLVVIGPERLPGAIKTGALWVGRIKRKLSETRREIEQHIGADDIRRELQNEEIMASLEKLRKMREELERDINHEIHAATLEHNTDEHTLEHQPEHGTHESESISDAIPSDAQTTSLAEAEKTTAKP